ncbi:RNA polymerase subunit sigma-24, partial [Streptomyces violaceoruber]
HHGVEFAVEPDDQRGVPVDLGRVHPHLHVQLDTVVAVRLDEGRITGLYAVRNPEKLSYMREEASLSR